VPYGRLATLVPYRPTPTWRVRRPAVSPAFLIAVVQGLLLATLTLPPMVFAPAMLCTVGVAIVLVTFGTPWFLATRLLNAYTLLAITLIIELWAWTTYEANHRWSNPVQVGLVVALVVVFAEVGWLIATHRIYREEPQPPPRTEAARNARGR